MDTTRRKVTLPSRFFFSSLKHFWLLPIICVFLLSCSSLPNPFSSSQQQSCGAVTSDNSGDYVSAQKTGTCFWNAYRRCQATSLSYKDEHAIQRTFTIVKNSSTCNVLDTIQSGTTTNKPMSYTCSQLQAGRGGNLDLRFLGCGKDGDITIAINPEIQ